MINAAYLHIPFCEHICHYCDFNKVFLKGQPVTEYLLAMEQEIKLTFEQNSPPDRLKTIFVGGGTPTALTEQQLLLFCEIIKNNLPFDHETEFTFEANPGDLSKEKFQILKQAGVNRISFGVQTFNNELLKRIGRTHRAEDVFKSVELAKETGFENISVDLIYSLPGQTIQDFKQTLSKAFSLDITHYSGYSLIIEPKTVFYNLLSKGKLPTQSEDIETEMYEILMDEMDKNGFNQYEISNFGLPGFESKHNLTYWNNESYYGFGAGAHSYVNGSRRSNYGPLKKYMDPIKRGQLPILDNHEVTKREAIEEEMFLGLRKIAGVSLSHFREKFAEDPLALFQDEIADLLNRGLIEINHDMIFLTKQGKFLGNEVFQSFI
ncbi:radical SAM family heme chaperone HemW [Bacillus sp. 1NLA3E]|uniref:radical SAM family heme chaperone HemW n=1 Tax=Bacillus sp. 1NLA3E TaxID=666686 RepID=UPI000247F05B|nr:radical SAM family heme chaperone HemW [Bacillus sp. 1NLA3E]